MEESAFTEAQLLGYEKFWDIISVEKTLYGSSWRRGIAEGRAAGLAEGRAEGRAEGIAEGKLEGRAEGEAEMKRQIAANLKKAGLPIEVIAQNTGLSEDEIKKL